MLIYTKLWNPLRFTHSRLLLLNFAHAEKLPSTKSCTLYFESQSLKSIISISQVSQEQKLCYRSPANSWGRYKLKQKCQKFCSHQSITFHSVYYFVSFFPAFFWIECFLGFIFMIFS